MDSVFFIYVHFLVIVPCPKCLFLIVVILESSGERQKKVEEFHVFPTPHPTYPLCGLPRFEKK